MNIFGIGGTDASGKDSLGQILSEEFGYRFISVTEILRAEAKRRGNPLERSTLRAISAQWRREHGMAVLVNKAVKEFEAAKEKYKGLAVASLRHPSEADRIHELGGKVIWIDASPKVRFERVKIRDRSSEDRVSFEEFLKEEQVQMHHSGDEATLSLAGVKERADIFIENNGDDKETLKQTVLSALNLD